MNRATGNPGTEVAQFRAAIESAGMVPPAVIKAGAFHRFPGVGKHKGNQAGFCKLFKDGLAGIYGCHASGLKEIWSAKNGRALTPAEVAVFEHEVAKARQQDEAERKIGQDAAAIKAQAIWNAAKDARPDHPYLLAKGIEPHGVREYRGQITIPVQVGGVIRSVQRINAKGKKLFLRDGEIKGGRFEVGNIAGATTLCVAEGFATAASIHEATGHPVAVAFDAGNLLPVAQDLRAKLPGIEIIICADDDAQTKGNVGLTKATEAAQAVGGLLAVPDFGADRHEGMTDFNDLHQARGLEAVRAQIDAATVPDDATAWQAPEPISTEEWTSARLTPTCIVEDYLFSDVAMLVGPAAYPRQRWRSSKPCTLCWVARCTD